MAGVDYAKTKYHVDEKRLGVTGYSYGGFLTNWVIGHTTRFVAAISGAGISNWISEEKRQPGRIRGPMACSTQPTMGCPTRSTTTTRHTVATPLCKA